MISRFRCHNIRIQGYLTQTEEEISALAVGNRFAYQLCTLFVIFGTVTANTIVLNSMAAIALLGTLLPNHPFDYLFNGGIRHIIDKPAVPRRSPQLRFACGIATVWLLATVWAFSNGDPTLGYWLGGSLAAVAALVATTDVCIPSMIYNFLFRINVPKS